MQKSEYLLIFILACLFDLIEAKSRGGGGFLILTGFWNDKCDTDFDCADKSDEYYCDYLRFGENYAKELIPRDETGGALIIYMNVSVLAFPFIETIDLKFTGYFY